MFIIQNYMYNLISWRNVCEVMRFKFWWQHYEENKLWYQQVVDDGNVVALW